MKNKLLILATSLLVLSLAPLSASAGDGVKDVQRQIAIDRVEHADMFSTIAERDHHMLECPKREEFNRKADQCMRKYQQNYAWIKAAQNAKKEKEQELGGNINAPASNQMPNLRYQYVMNEPFVGGIKDAV